MDEAIRKLIDDGKWKNLSKAPTKKPCSLLWVLKEDGNVFLSSYHPDLEKWPDCLFSGEGETYPETYWMETPPIDSPTSNALQVAVNALKRVGSINYRNMKPEVAKQWALISQAEALAAIDYIKTIAEGKGNE